MRCSYRNKQAFWYAPYIDKVPVTDEYGNESGWEVLRGNPVKVFGNISAAKGDVVARQFGDDDLYDRVIVLENRDTPIDEYSVLWIDEEPELNDDGSLVVDDETGTYLTPWNYIVRKVGRGLPTFGGAILAVDKVTVT